jgi:hypothetical protein
VTGDQVQVIVGTFDDAKHADKGPNNMGSVTLVGSLELVDAAALLRHLEGRIQIEEPADADQDMGPQGPSLAGELVGLIFPPGTLTSPVRATAEKVPGGPDLSSPEPDLGDNLVQQMQRLAVLRDRDVLTEAEYQRQRTLLTLAARDRREIAHQRPTRTEPRIERGDDSDDS